MQVVRTTVLKIFVGACSVAFIIVLAAIRVSSDSLTILTPQAVRDLAEGYTDSDVTDAPTSTPEDRHARATALILAAIVDGLTASPDDLSGKHRANRANRAAVPPEQATGAEAGARVTTPAMQKVRDFQLQVTFSA